MLSAVATGGRTIVLGVSGGIAAYKSAELVRLLRKQGVTVHVAMTRAAREFVTPLVLQTLSGRPVMTDLFDLGQESQIGHIQLADAADLMVIAPATADVIARLAAGMADDAVTTIALATRAPLLLAPAMNVHMWEHPITRRNVDALGATGRVLVAGPGAGELACGWVGQGRMLEPVQLVEAVLRALEPPDLAGRKVLVTAGPTWEPVDPVRFLGNRSSGKMGFAVARAAARRGARVELVAGPVGLETPPGVERIRVETAAELREAVRARWRTCDAVVMAAAVADFRPVSPAANKIHRDHGGASAPLSLELAPNADILAELGAERAGAGGTRPLLVGFAAETTRGDRAALLVAAQGKLARKQCDLVVANDVSQPSAGFDVDTNEVMVVGKNGQAPQWIGPATKSEVAEKIVDRLVGELGDGR
jgi:phosphopantothenoylcysteine decarboxylase/phosphopantothenate--cysteine ligase